MPSASVVLNEERVLLSHNLCLWCQIKADNCKVHSNKLIIKGSILIVEEFALNSTIKNASKENAQSFNTV